VALHFIEPLVVGALIAGGLHYDRGQDSHSDGSQPKGGRRRYQHWYQYRNRDRGIGGYCDRRLAKNQNGKRQVVVAVKERGGRTVPAVFRAEVDALGFIIQRVHPASKLMADKATSWNELHFGFDLSRIDHCQLYSTESGIYTNGAEEFFSRMRRPGLKSTSRN
jgi:hypothetical protein